MGLTGAATLLLTTGEEIRATWRAGRDMDVLYLQMGRRGGRKMAGRIITQSHIQMSIVKYIKVDNINAKKGKGGYIG